MKKYGFKREAAMRYTTQKPIKTCLFPENLLDRACLAL